MHSTTSYKKRIARAVLFIEKHLEDSPTLDEIAQEAGFSPFHFHRLFTGIMGESVKSFQRRLRIERSATWLAYTERTIADIAFEAGYDSQEAFTRAFKNIMGETPKRYRNHGTPDAIQRGGTTLNLIPENPHFTLENFNLSIEVTPLPPLRVACIRHTGSYFECGWAWEKLCGWAAPKGLITPKTQFLGISHDDPAVTDPQRIRFDVCITIDHDIEETEFIRTKTIPGGDYARSVYKGSYTNLQSVYASILGSGIPKLGREYENSPSIEAYLNTPDKTPEDELLTEIRIPLKCV